MTQPEFDWSRPGRLWPTTKAQAHSPTSREAAKRIAPSTATLRDQVLAFLQDRAEEGATDEEIQVGLNLNPSTERPRRIELVEAGFVSDSGTTRPTVAGRKAVVWMVSALVPRVGESPF